MRTAVAAAGRALSTAVAIAVVLGVPLPARAEPAVSAASAEPVRSSTVTLREIAAGAGVIATVEVGSVQLRDGDRVRVAPAMVREVLSGAPLPERIHLVELRIGTDRAPLLETGSHAVVLLKPLSRVSYLQSVVPEQASFEIAGERSGIVAFAGDAERSEVETAVGRAHAAASAAQIRAHAFDQLAARTARLQEDGALELQRLAGGVGVLDQRERNVVAALLGDATAAEQTRVLVIDALASSADRALAPLLVGAHAGSSRVLESLLRARAAVGAPAPQSELDLLLVSNRAGFRAATLRVLTASGHPQALILLRTASAEGQPRDVRLAAIDALGSHGEAAIEALSRAFESDERAIKQAAARAILAAGASTDPALIRLALEGTSRETRTYAAMLLMTRHRRDAPALQALASADAPADVREVLEHGLRDNHAHQH